MTSSPSYRVDLGHPVDPGRPVNLDQGQPPEVTVGGYRLLTRLGEGGMGVVHLAQRPGGDRVALKVIRPHVVGDDEARARLAREVGSLSRIRSPRVAEILDADPWGVVPYVATRYVPGLSLYDQVKREGVITGRDLAWFARCLAEALSAVHAVGVLHRDIKPSNVLMEGRTPVLIDFGLARVAEDPRLTQPGWLLGTPGYLAPEILFGDDATSAVDVHGWAATVAYAGTGRAPFGRGPSMAIMDRVRRGEHDLTGLDAHLYPLVHAALDPEPRRRPTLEQVLGRLGGTTAVVAPRVAPVVAPPTAYAPPAPATQVARTAPLALVPPPSTQPMLDPGWSPPQTYVQAPLAERLRRSVLLLGVGAALAGATAIAPWVTMLTTLFVAWLLRSGSRAGSAVGERRRYRGARWYDAPQAVLASPFHLLAAIPGTIVLGLWAAGLALAAALICYTFAWPVDTSLGVIGAAYVAGLWIGPGGGRVRRPVRRVVHPVAARGIPWLVAAAVVLAVASGAWSLVQTSEVNWAPAAHAPWESAPLSWLF